MNLKLLFLPLSIIVSLVCFIYFTKPTWDDYKNTKILFEENTASLNEIKNSKNILDRELIVYDEIAMENKFLLKNSIPEDLQEENFLKEISDIVLGTGVEISSMKLAAKKESYKKAEIFKIGDDIKETNVSIELSGSYFEIKKAIYALENMNRFINLGIFSIKKSSEEEVSDLALSLNLTFFHKNNNDLALNSNDDYFKSLLKNGLEMGTIDEYKNHREKVLNFSLIEIGEKGIDNLFNSSIEIIEVAEAMEAVETE